MLIVLQGPKKSGKTTLAHAIAKLAGKQLVPMRQRFTARDYPLNGIYILDNIEITEQNVSQIREFAKTYNVIVTTTDNWPQGDYVIPMTALGPYEHIPQESIL